MQCWQVQDDLLLRTVTSTVEYGEATKQTNP